MISYDSPSAGPRRPGRRPPRRPGTGTVAVLALAGAVIAAAVIVVHGITSGPVAKPTPGPTPGPVVAQAPLLSLGACIDPTLSTEASFATAIRHDLAAGIGRLDPPGGAPDTGTATPAVPGMSLLVREVDTTSFATDPGPYTAQVSVPGVPGLTRARPVPGNLAYATALAVWSQAAQSVTAARQAAAAAVPAAAQAVAALPLDQNPQSNSAISACISALLVNVPAGGQHSYLLASDLEENETPQLEGSFNGAPLIIVQACDSGSANQCQGLLQHFVTLMHRLDVGPITVIRPEDAGPDIAQWIRTGEVP